MEIYLLRPGSSSASSSETHLSLEGRQVIRAIGSKIHLTEEPNFDRFLVSPDVAAVQSAELFADRNDYIGVIEALPLLADPNTPPAVIAAKILETKSPLKEFATVLVCANEPLLASIGAFLVGRPTFPPAIPGQVSVVKDRKPAWCLRPGELARQLLLVA